MNVFEQASAYVEFLPSPIRTARFLVQAKRRDGLLGSVELALLLVVIEDTRHRVQVFRIRIQGRPCLIQKLAQTLGLGQQIKITFHQLRRP